MNFSQYAGIAIVPTLSRLVLAAVFVMAGYGKVFKDAEFIATPDGNGPANVLHGLGVTVTPKTPPVVITRSASLNHNDWQIVPASMRQEAPQNDPASPQTPPADEPVITAPVPDAPSVPDAPTAPAVTSGGLAPGTYTARGLHNITVMLEQHGWPMPAMQGWAAAITELVGGALLLIGLFSRIWGLGLAIVMVVAFYLTSLPVLQTTALLEIPMQQSTTMFFQAALFVLALGIFMTGAGPLSLDRILFDSKSPPPADDPKMR